MYFVSREIKHCNLPKMKKKKKIESTTLKRRDREDTFQESITYR